LLAAEATAALVNSYAQMRVLPFRRVAALRGLRPIQPAATTANPAVAVDVEAVGWAVRAVGQRTPWTSTCLMQALAGSAMLHRRRVHCSVHLAVAPGDGGYDAHAWLSVGDRVVIGESGMAGYTEVGRYAHGEG
jgi:hypothetical protein